MSLHVRLCAACARIDTRVRRALLLAHNLPVIEPSASFNDRLQTRLRQERAIMAGHATRHGTVGMDGLIEGRWRPLSTGTYAALAAGILVAAGLAVTLKVAAADRGPLRLAPVVATLPEREPALASSAMVASMPGGFSVWPAVFMAQQGAWHLADDAAAK